MNRIKEFIFKQKIFSKCSADEQKMILEELSKIELQETMIDLLIAELSENKLCPFHEKNVKLSNCDSDTCINDIEGMCWREYIMNKAKGMKQHESKKGFVEDGRKKNVRKNSD